MPDLLAKLYSLPDAGPVLAALKSIGIDVRRAKSSEKHVVSATARPELRGTERNP